MCIARLNYSIINITFYSSTWYQNYKEKRKFSLIFKLNTVLITGETLNLQLTSTAKTPPKTGLHCWSYIWSLPSCNPAANSHRGFALFSVLYSALFLHRSTLFSVLIWSVSRYNSAPFWHLFCYIFMQFCSFFSTLFLHAVLLCFRPFLLYFFCSNFQLQLLCFPASAAHPISGCILSCSVPCIAGTLWPLPDWSS